MILSFEGPSAVGKSSMSRLLADRFQVVPEANHLFAHEVERPRMWYFEKQAQRFQLAAQASHAILDGDPFQPLWYNWTYGYPPEYQNLDEMELFYQKAISNGQIRFPDLYLIFSASEASLRQRKAIDPVHKRRNFEKHLRLTRTLPQYFAHLKSEFPGLVLFIPYDDQQQAKEQVEKAIEAREGGNNWDNLNVLECICNWLRSNQPVD